MLFTDIFPNLIGKAPQTVSLQKSIDLLKIKELEIMLFKYLMNELDGCVTAFKEESPDSSEHQSRVIPGEGNLRESATENIPPY